MMRFPSKLGVLFTVIGLVYGLVTSGLNQSLAASANSPLVKVRVGLIEFSPLVRLEGKEPVGPLVDYANEIFQNAGVTANFSAVSILRSLEELKANNLDMVLTLFKTPEREIFTRFSELPFLIVAPGVCSLQSIETKPISKKTRIAHIQGTIIEQRLAGLALIPVTGDKTQFRMLQMLLNNRVDLIYTPKPEIILLTARQAGIAQNMRCYNLKGTRWPIHFGFSKQLDSALQARIEQSLKERLITEDFDSYFLKSLSHAGIPHFKIIDWDVRIAP